MLKIDIKTIPHSRQRYDTVGDWFNRGSKEVILISDMDDWRYEFLVAFHELIEKKLCEQSGITEEQVTSWDLNFEDLRKKGAHSDTEEPGDDPDAPYSKQHTTATIMEQMMAKELGVDWESYENKVNSL